MEKLKYTPYVILDQANEVYKTYEKINKEHIFKKINGTANSLRINSNSDDYFLLGLNKIISRINYETANSKNNVFVGTAPISSDLQKSSFFEGGIEFNSNSKFLYLSISQNRFDSMKEWNETNYYNTVGFIRKEDGAFQPYKIKVNRRELKNGEYRDIITEIQDSIKAPIYPNKYNSAIPGLKSAVAKTHGLTNTISASSEYSILSGLVGYTDIRTTALTDDNVSYIQKIDEVEKLFSSFKYNLEAPSSVNFENLFSGIDTRYNIKQGSYTFKDFHIALSFNEMNNLFYHNDFENSFFAKEFFGKANRSLEEKTKILKDTSFIFKISKDGEYQSISGVYALERNKVGIHKVKFSNALSEARIKNLTDKNGLNEIKYYEENTAKVFKNAGVNISELNIHSSALNVNMQAYLPITARGDLYNSSSKLNLLESINSVFIDAGLYTGNDRDMEQIGKVIKYIYNEDFNHLQDNTNTFVEIREGFKQTLNVGKVKKFKKDFDYLINEMAHEYIIKEDVQRFSNIPFDITKQTPIDYLQEVVSNDTNLAKGPMQNVNSFLNTINPNTLLAHLLSAGKFYKYNLINKQSQNATGMFKLLKVDYGALSFLDTSSQRNSQASDALGSYVSSEGIDFNKNIGKLFSLAKDDDGGLGYQGSNIIKSDGILVKNKIIEFMKNKNPNVDLNGFENFNPLTSTRARVAVTVGPTSFQDSDVVASTTTTRLLSASDKIDRKVIDSSSINYQKIKKFGSDSFYRSKKEFDDDFVKLKLASSEDFFNPDSFAGSLVSQILGKDNYLKVIKQRNELGINFNNLTQSFEETFKNANTKQTQALAVGNFTKEYTNFLEENFITIKSGKSSMLNTETTGAIGTVSGANYVDVRNIEFDPESNNLVLNYQKLRITDNGSKFLANSHKGTVNVSSPHLMYIKHIGDDGTTHKASVDQVMSFKTGSAKRGFGATLLEDLLISMNTRMTDVSFNDQIGLDKVGKLNKFQREFMEKKFIKMPKIGGGTVSVSPNELLGINIKLENGDFYISSKYTEESLNAFLEQYDENNFINFSYGLFKKELFDRNLEKLGVSITNDEQSIVGNYILNQLADEYISYTKENVSKSDIEKAKIFYQNKGSKIIGTILNPDGTIDETTLQKLSEGETLSGKGLSSAYTIVLDMNINAMAESIAQKSSGATKLGATGQSIFSRIGFDKINDIIRTKSLSTISDELDIVYNYNEANKYISDEKSISDFINITIDASNGKEMYRALNKNITLEEYKAGNYLFSKHANVTDVTSGTMKSALITISPLETDYAFRLKGVVGANSESAINTYSLIGKSVIKNHLGVSDIEYIPSQNILKKISSISKEFINGDIDSDTALSLEKQISSFILEDYKDQIENLEGKDSVIENINKIVKNDLSQSFVSRDKGILYERLSLMSSYVDEDDNKVEIIKSLNIKKDGSRNNKLRSDTAKKIYGKEYDIVQKYYDSNSEERAKLFFGTKDVERTHFYVQGPTFSTDGTLVYSDSFFKAHDLVEIQSRKYEINSDLNFLKKLNDVSKKGKTEESFIKAYQDYFHKIDSDTEIKNKKDLIEVLGGKDIFEEKFKNYAGEEIINKIPDELDKRKVLKMLLKHQTDYTNSKIENLESIYDEDFLEFTIKNFTFSKDKSVKEINRTFETDTKKYIPNKLLKVFEKHNEKDIYRNPIYFYNIINNELKIAKKENVEYHNYLKNLKNYVFEEYVEKEMLEKILSKSNKSLNNVEGMNTVYNSILKTNIQEIIDIKNKDLKSIERLEENLIKTLNELTTEAEERIDEEALNGRVFSSMPADPMDGQPLNRATFTYFTGLDFEEKKIFEDDKSLFFNKGKLITDINSIEAKYKTFEEDLLHIYGDTINIKSIRGKYEEIVDMIRKGKSINEIADNLSDFQKELSEDLDGIIGVSLLSEDKFHTLTKNSKSMIQNINGRKSISGFATRNPTNYNTSHIASRIVEIKNKQIQNSEFLRKVFPKGEWGQRNNLNSSMIVGLKTLLAMFGDYDGDNITLSTLSTKDFNDTKKGFLEIQPLREKMTTSFNILNSLSRDVNILEEIRKTDLENSRFNWLKNSIINHGLNKKILSIGENGYSFEKGFTLNSLRESFIDEHKLFILTMSEALPEVKYRMFDEIEGLVKDLAQPYFEVEAFKGKENSFKINNNFIHKVYNTVDTKTLTFLKNRSEDDVKELISELIKSDKFTKDEEEILKKFLSKDGTEEFRNIFSFDSLNKTFKGKGNAFGVIDNSQLKINYTQNALTGLLSNKLHSRFDKALDLSEVHKLRLLFGDLSENFLKDDHIFKSAVKNFLGTESISEEEINELSKSIKSLINSANDGELVEKVISSKHGAKGKFTPVMEIEKMIDNFYNEMVESKIDTGNGDYKTINPFNIKAKTINESNKWFTNLRFKNLYGKTNEIKNISLNDLFDILYDKNDIRLQDDTTRNKIIAKHFKNLLDLLSASTEEGKGKEFIDSIISSKNVTISNLADALDLDLDDLNVGKYNVSKLIGAISLYFSGFLNSVNNSFEDAGGKGLKIRNNAVNFFSTVKDKLTVTYLRTKAVKEYKEQEKIKLENEAKKSVNIENENTIKKATKEINDIKDEVHFDKNGSVASSANHEFVEENKKFGEQFNSDFSGTQNEEKIIEKTVDEIVEELNPNEKVKNFKENIEEKASEFIKETNDLNEEKIIKETEKVINENISNQSNNSEKVNEAKKIVNDIFENIKETGKKAYNKAKETVNKGKKVAEETTETVDETVKVAEEAEKTTKKIKGKNKGLLIGSAALVTIGGFLHIINRNRSVVHLEKRDQLNNNVETNPNQSLQRRMGQYQIHTTIRDLF